MIIFAFRTILESQKGMVLVVSSCFVLFSNILIAEPSLLQRNPFYVENLNEPEEQNTYDEVPRIDDNIYFMGSYKIGENRLFSINFTEVGQKKWMKVNDSYFGIKILDFVEDKLSLFVEYNGHEGILKLAEKGGSQDSRLRSRSSPEGSSNPSMRRPNAPPPKMQVKPPLVIPRRVSKPANMGKPHMVMLEANAKPTSEGFSVSSKS